MSGPIEDAENLGVELAEQLLQAGGRPILEEIYGTA